MLSLIDHRLTVPLDYSEPDRSSIEVFAREVVPDGGAELPLLVYLQGGPGQESPRPSVRPAQPPWLERALQEYRVLFLDQRGTGLSTPFGSSADAHAATQNPDAVAEYLTHFRADAIVQDAERFRQHLGLDNVSLLGQSFGGFTSLHYLTVAADSLGEVYFTGGLPPVGRHCDDVYTATYATQRTKNEAFYEAFPAAQDQMRKALARCDDGDVTLPNGTPLTSRLLRTIGSQLGFTGGDEKLAYLLERDPLSPAFAADVAAMLPFNGRNPLYAVIHESSYADGGVTGWSGERVLPADFADDPTLFTSEHIFRWHFTDDAGLAPFKKVAETLAHHRWPQLYDADVLATTGVPCAAAVFTTDPYVELAFSRETAQLLPNLTTWETADHDHNAIRVDGGEILDHLFALV